MISLRRDSLFFLVFRSILCVQIIDFYIYIDDVLFFAENKIKTSFKE